MFYVFVTGAIIVLALLWVMMTYNQLIRLRLMTKEAWSGIDVQLKRRYDLIPNLMDIVKGYSVHEKDVIDNVVQMRAESMKATSVEEKQEAAAGLAGSLKSLFALAEQYPELKANENFLALQNELSSVEQELQFARRYYNGAARNYVVSIQQFPSNMIAKLFGFSEVSYFETTEEERSIPKTKF